MLEEAVNMIDQGIRVIGALGDPMTDEKLSVAFFLPWALALDKLGMFGVAAMFVFVLELVIGYFVIWKRGALEWE